MAERTGRFNLMIEPDLLAELHRTAKAEDRSVAAVIRRACWAYVQGQDQKHGLTRP